MVHVKQIRHALGLDRIAVDYYSWRSESAPRAQVDMIIERSDRLINLCEIKYAQTEFTITAEEERKVKNRIAAFVRESKTRFETEIFSNSDKSLIADMSAATILFWNAGRSCDKSFVII